MIFVWAATATFIAWFLLTGAVCWLDYQEGLD